LHIINTCIKLKAYQKRNGIDVYIQHKDDDGADRAIKLIVMGKVVDVNVEEGDKHQGQDRGHG